MLRFETSALVNQALWQNNLFSKGGPDTNACTPSTTPVIDFYFAHDNMLKYVYITPHTISKSSSQFTFFNSNYCLLRNATDLAEKVGETKDIEPRLQ